MWFSKSKIHYVTSRYRMRIQYKKAFFQRKAIDNCWMQKNWADAEESNQQLLEMSSSTFSVSRWRLGKKKSYSMLSSSHLNALRIPSLSFLCGFTRRFFCEKNPRMVVTSSGKLEPFDLSYSSGTLELDGDTIGSKG